MEMTSAQTPRERMAAVVAKHVYDADQACCFGCPWVVLPHVFGSYAVQYAEHLVSALDEAGLVGEEEWGVRAEGGNGKPEWWMGGDDTNTAETLVRGEAAGPYVRRFVTEWKGAE